MPAVRRLLGALLLAAVSGRAAEVPSRGPIPFSSLTPASMDARYLAARASFDRAVARILAVPPAERRFANTARALEQAAADYDEQVGYFNFLTDVSPDPALREAAENIEEAVSAHNAAVWARPELYQAILDAEAKGEALDPQDKLMLEVAHESFERSGAHLPEEARARFQNVQERLSELSTEFQTRINEDTSELLVPPEGLAGLSERYRKGLEHGRDGRFAVTLKYPHYQPFMRHADDAVLREALERVYLERAKENSVTLAETLALRHEQARLLGHRNFAEWSAKDFLAKTPARIGAYLRRTVARLKPRARQELDDMLALKRREDPRAERIAFSDRHYWGSRLRQERFGIDDEALRPYFPAEKVIQGTFKILERAGLRFVEETAPDAWHPDVRQFRMEDADGPRGDLFLDLHPRDDKYTHTVTFNIRDRRLREDGSVQTPAAVIVGNFAAPTPGRPALWSPAEVEDFVHEIGHAIHVIGNKARYASFAGLGVALDFSEAPSQLFELLLWTPDFLREISGHWEDGRPMSPDLMGRLIAAREAFDPTGLPKALYEISHRAARALVDLSYHTSPPADPSEVYRRIVGEAGLVPLPEDTHPEASFDHLFGYEAGYHSYLWSLNRYARRMARRFKREGILNPRTWRSYMREVIEWGGGRPELDSLRAFLLDAPRRTRPGTRSAGEPGSPEDPSIRPEPDRLPPV